MAERRKERKEGGALRSIERQRGLGSLSKVINLRRIVLTVRGVPVLSAVVLVCFVFVGIFGNYIACLALHDPIEAHFEDVLLPPFFQEGGKITYPLGTDQLGRDELSRLLSGARISLHVGFLVTVISGTIGTLIALVSGYLGRWIDEILMRITDIMLSMPYLMIAIVLAAVLGQSKNNLILVLAIMGWANYARVLRGEVLRLREKEFVSLAVIAGCSKKRIMSRHIFPNIVNTLIILATLQVGFVIIAEASLSFLGVGVPPPQPAWGLMVAEGRAYMSSAWWLCAWPGLAILLVVLSCNLLGDWLRVRLDPNLRQL